jgi:hypothetical protein
VALCSAFPTSALIRDLFDKMVFDTYQTRPSHDGDVDCFAFLQGQSSADLTPASYKIQQENHASS